MLLSLTSIAAIVIVLIKYDGRVFPSVPGDISLNAIVATLSTISKTSLIFSVSAVLGQLKWDWCEQQPRQLEDLDIFDQASRGPLGGNKAAPWKDRSVRCIDRGCHYDSCPRPRSIRAASRQDSARGVLHWLGGRLG